MLAASVFCVYPQARVPDNACPVKFAEFGHISDRELDGRLRDLFDRLNRQPQLSAYVIAYAGADAEPADRDRVIVFDRIRHLITVRNYDDSRFVMIYGGFRQTQAAEFFLLTSNSEPPEPSWTVAQPEIPVGKTLLWAKQDLSSGTMEGILEEFVNRAVLYRSNLNDDGSESEAPDYNGPAYTEEDDDVPTVFSQAGDDGPLAGYENNGVDVVEPAGADTAPDQLDDGRFDWIDKGFGEAIADREGAHGVMIYYADDQYYDTARLHAFIEAGRDRLAEAAGLGPEQIEVTFGGYRPRVQIEYWLVTGNGEPPVATPRSR